MTFRRCWRRWPNARLPAQSGTFTSMLLARSCHISVPSLERNARPGVDAVARQVAQPGPAARRKR
ncbi:PmrA [Streptomyces sp. Pv4-95]|uniref:PmrA n=1 Tax=Streptomyces sp. Pv4-95 TaxID=3049543 RepID=UPI00389160FD